MNGPSLSHNMAALHCNPGRHDDDIIRQKGAVNACHEHMAHAFALVRSVALQPIRKVQKQAAVLQLSAWAFMHVLRDVTLKDSQAAT